MAVLILAIASTELALLSADWAPPLLPREARLWLSGSDPSAAWPFSGPIAPGLLALSAQLCSLEPACLRLAAPLGHALTAWLVYRCGLRLFDARTGIWSALLYVSAPLVVRETQVMDPLALLMPVWSLALLTLVRARAGSGIIDWVLLGLSFGCGVLVSPVMMVFAPLAFLYLATGTGAGRLWRGAGPYVAGLVAAATLLPYGAWNAVHDWRGFTDLWTSLSQGLSISPMDAGTVPRLLGLGALAGGPVIAIVFVILLARLPLEIWRGALRDDRVRLLMLFTTPVLAVGLGLAVAWDGGIHLTLPALGPIVMMVTAWLLVRDKAVWLWLALLANLCLALAMSRGPETLNRMGWVVPEDARVFSEAENWTMAERWLAALAETYPDTPITVAGADGPLIAYYGARAGVSVEVTGPGGTSTRAKDGLMILPEALAKASGAPIRARLSIVAPGQGTARAWAAVSITAEGRDDTPTATSGEQGSER
jgi:4-amino-4-deoxy-L-arabinose transferase-like glycosyltransferase